MSLGRSLYFSGIASALKVVFQFGLSIYVARVLTPEEIGSFGVALAAMAIVRAFESAGINNFVASFKDLTAPLMRTVFTVNWGLNLALAAILLALAKPLAIFFDSPAVGQIVLVTVVATAINTHLPIIQGLMRREGRFKGLLWVDLALLAVTAAVTISAVSLGYGALSLAFALVAEKAAAALIGMTLFRGNIPMTPRLAERETVLKYGLSLSFATVIGIIGSHANNFILGRLLGLAPSAQFDRAYTLPRLIWQVALPGFTNVLVPESARKNRDDGSLEATLTETVHAFTLLLWPVCLALALVSPELVLLLFGDQWREAAAISPWLILYGALASPVTLLCASLVSLGYGRELIELQLVENVSKVMILMMAPLFGLEGLAIAMAIPALAYSAYALRVLTRLRLVSLAGALRAMLRPGVISLVSTAPVTVAVMLSGTGPDLTLPTLIGVAAATTLLYLACLMAWERAFLNRMLALVLRKKA